MRYINVPQRIFCNDKRGDGRLFEFPETQRKNKGETYRKRKGIRKRPVIDHKFSLSI